MVLDYIIGGKHNKHGIPPCPGLPRGGITQIWGHEGSGKTTVALTAAAKVCKNGGKNKGPGTVVMIDWEHAVDLSYAEAIGVPIHDRDRFRLHQPATMEQGLGIIWAMTQVGVDLVIIDSVGAGVPEAHLKQKDSEKGELGRVGLVAAKWSKLLSELAGEAKKSGTTILAISQVRKKINTTGRGPSSHPQGGEAWKFYSSVRMAFRRVQYEKGKVYDPLTHKMVETAVKSVIAAKVEKCKVAATQGREANIRITFGEGIDDLRSVIDIASAHRIVQKKGSWFEFQSIRGQGSDQFKGMISETPGAKEALYKLVFDKLAQVDNKKIISDLTEEDEADLSDLDSLFDEEPEVPDGAEEEAAGE
jgi:recombination protein RecA